MAQRASAKLSRMSTCQKLTGSDRAKVFSMQIKPAIPVRFMRYLHERRQSGDSPPIFSLRFAVSEGRFAADIPEENFSNRIPGFPSRSVKRGRSGGGKRAASEAPDRSRRRYLKPRRDHAEVGERGRKVLRSYPRASDRAAGRTRSLKTPQRPRISRSLLNSVFQLMRRIADCGPMAVLLSGARDEAGTTRLARTRITG